MPLARAGFLRHRPAMTKTLDDRDHRILDLLKANAWLSYIAIAERVNLSASAVQRRVERLMADGIIRGARAEVSLPGTTGGLSIYLLVELRDDTAATIKAFTRMMSAQEQVVAADYVTGEADVVLKVHVADMAAYDRFVRRHVNHSALVRRFKTLAELRRLK
jgi:DNA-binding Lrp family transcriptional regulator